MRRLVLAVAVLLAACGGAPEQVTQEPTTAAPAATTPAATQAPASEAAPALGPFDFTVPAVGGGQIAGADLVGRDLALWFWAPW